MAVTQIHVVYDHDSYLGYGVFSGTPTFSISGSTLTLGTFSVPYGLGWRLYSDISQDPGYLNTDTAWLSGHDLEGLSSIDVPVVEGMRVLYFSNLDTQQIIAKVYIVMYPDNTELCSWALQSPGSSYTGREGVISGGWDGTNLKVYIGLQSSAENAIYSYTGKIGAAIEEQDSAASFITFTNRVVTLTSLQNSSGVMTTLASGQSVYIAGIDYVGSPLWQYTATLPTPAAPAPDTTAPTVTLTGDATINLAYGASWTDPGVTATDDSGSTPSLVITYSVNGSAEDDFDSTQAGTWTITYTATDGAGNTGSAERTVIVAQQTPATTTETTTMQWTDTSTLEASTTYYYRAVVSNGDNTITSNTDSVTTSAAPAADTTAPTVTLTGEATINLAYGASWTDPGATAMDETDGTLTVTATGTVDTQTAGTYTITYTATDAAGNTGTATRSVIVAAAIPPDTTAPVVTLTGDATINLANGASWIDPGATATDETDGTLTVTATGTVDTQTAGTYTITYTATDGAGNTGSAERTVIVSEYNLATTTFSAEAHATSSTLIRCALTPALGQLSGITVVWEQTTTDPTGATPPTWTTSTGTVNTNGSLVISGLTPNTKYWFRAVLTQGAQTQTTGSDPAWLTQIIGPAEAVHETGIIEKDFGEVMIFLARLTNAAGECLTAEEISTIKYTISKLNTTHYSDTFTAVTGHSTVTVSNFPSILEPYPLCEYGWDLDDIGYNFAFAPSNAVSDPYSSEGLYKIEFIATLTTGEQLKWNYSIYFANKPTTPI